MRKGISGMRWRVWMRVASWVRVVTGTPVHMRTNFLMLTALTLSSLPWSMTLSTSSGPIKERVSCMPPVPQPRPMGSSREPKGTW